MDERKRRDGKPKATARSAGIAAAGAREGQKAGWLWTVSVGIPKVYVHVVLWALFISSFWAATPLSLLSNESLSQSEQIAIWGHSGTAKRASGARCRRWDGIEFLLMRRTFICLLVHALMKSESTAFLEFIFFCINFSGACSCLVSLKGGS